MEDSRGGNHQTEWITISTDEYYSMQRTIEVLSDKDLMDQINAGRKGDVKVKDFDDLVKELDI